MRYIVIVLLLAVAACGSSEEGDDTLTLWTRDYTADEYRTEIRAFLIGNTVLCHALDGLSDSEIIETVKAANEQMGQTPHPGRQADPEDAERAGGIIRDECQRVRGLDEGF